MNIFLICITTTLQTLTVPVMKLNQFRDREYKEFVLSRCGNHFNRSSKQDTSSVEYYLLNLIGNQMLTQETVLTTTKSILNL